MNQTIPIPKVSLRAVMEEDLPILFEQQRNPVANRMAAVPARERENFFAHWEKIMAGEGNILRTVLYRGQVAGNMLSWKEEGQRKVGYWLGQEFWGQGVGSQALALFLEEVAERPLFADVAKHNIASTRILQKCGFVVIDEEVGAYGPEDPEEVAMWIMRLSE